jgi:phosphoribosyl-ATP pyrophosphohydrolase
LSTPSPESAPSEFTAEHPTDSAAGPGETAAADLGETAAPSPERVLSSLLAVIRGRREQMPEGSYTSYLFGEGLEKIKKKTGEEAIELILAEKPEDIVHEASDLLYHLLVLLEATGLSWDDVSTELANRSM